MFGIFKRAKNLEGAAHAEELRQPDHLEPNEDLLLHAARYVTIVSAVQGRPDLYVTNISDPIRCSSPGKVWDGVCFLLSTREGVGGKIYFFPDFVSAWPDGESSPWPQIPNDYIRKHFPNYDTALGYLFKTVLAPTDIRSAIAH